MLRIVAVVCSHGRRGSPVRGQLEPRHEPAFGLELRRAECEPLTGALQAAEERLHVLWGRAGDLTAAVTCLRLDLYTTLDQSDRGVDACLGYLRRRGVEWSPHPTKDEVLREYERLDV